MPLNSPRFPEISLRDLRFVKTQAHTAGWERPRQPQPPLDRQARTSLPHIPARHQEESPAGRLPKDSAPAVAPSVMDRRNASKPSSPLAVLERAGGSRPASASSTPIAASLPKAAGCTSDPPLVRQDAPPTLNRRAPGPGRAGAGGPCSAAGCSMRGSRSRSAMVASCSRPCPCQLSAEDTADGRPSRHSASRARNNTSTASSVALSSSAPPRVPLFRFISFLD